MAIATLTLISSHAVDAASARLGKTGAGAASVTAPLPPARPAGLGAHLPQQRPTPRDADSEPTAPQGCVKQFEAMGGKALPAETSSTTGDCAVAEPVTFKEVTMPDGAIVGLESAVTVRCSLALDLARWIRDDLGPIAAGQGSTLARLNGVGGQACRLRNGQPGAPVSEHASGNAFDLQALTLTDRRVIRLGSSDAETKAIRELVKAAACTKFRTVLGPGSDSFHADHLHLDMRQRKRDAKLCQWVVK